MEGELAFHDPLSFNLKKQTRLLLTKIAADDIYHASLTNAQSIPEIFSILSTLLAISALTIPVAKLFRPILFDLCARFLEKEENTEEELVALCLLVEVHEELFPILYQILKRPLFSNGPLHDAVELMDPVDESRIHRLLLAYWRILSVNRQLPDQLFWSLSPLYKLACSKERSTGTRLLAIRCYAFQSGMGEAEREKWEHEAVGKDSEVDCPLDYGVNEGVQVTMDGWLLPVVEYKRVREARNAMVTEDHGYYGFEGGDEQHVLETSVLSPFTANIYGVFLLKSRPALETTSDTALVSTPTAISALRTISLNFSDRLPILITSPPSSGKSLFISHLASSLFPGSKNQIVIIQLADTSLDPRSLLGNYVSSLTQPGVFEWKEGVLVRAMREGKWVVFKDIDRASNDVLGLIKPLVESLEPGKKWIGGRATIEVHGHGRVVAEDTFAIFATRSVNPSRSGTFPVPTFFGAHKFTEVVVPSPSIDELRSIVNRRLPRLAGGAARGLIRMWEGIRAVGSTSSTRDIELKDLEKYCTRVERMLPTSPQSMDIDMEDGTPLPAIFPHPHVREEMFLAARDIYFGGGASTSAARARLLSISQTVGAHLGLDEERQDWLLNKWKPEESEFGFEKDVNGVVTGVRMKRAWIQAKPQNKLSGMGMNTGRPFAMHRPATILLSRIVTAISFGEPLLLTGETGTGKTSVITHLANTLRQPLVSLNLSHQTESSDLVGGFRPVDTRIPATRLFDQWLDLFAETFSRKKNEKLEKGLREAVQKGKWKQAVSWWKGSVQKAKEQIQNKRQESEDPSKELDSQNPRKRRKLDASTLNDSEARWSAFGREVDEFNTLHVEGKGRFAFAFVEGPLVKALRTGDWVLLDEINLASPETLECISSILQSPTASITLTEQGSLEPVPRHPNFRLFACMNPATDVGKKDLPPNIRSRFTEIEVPPPDADRETLLSIVEQYIGHCAVGDKKRIHCVSEFYLAVKNLSETRQIADGSNHRPHYSMRTLARALTFAADIAPTYSLRRAIWEGCMMAFTMVLDAPSAAKVVDLAKELLLPEVKNGQSMNTFMAKDPPPPQPAAEYVKFGPFYLETGELPTDPVDDYIMTPSVYTKLTDLARIILTRRFPVLIEGPTSSGKTSAVEYLAKRTGHRFVRINNHEHTDIQEYLGSYVSDPQTGKLVFTDGLLVRALRNGDWIVLDELNLAPTDVLEALNRLLDDNRELVIPETGEVIKPHRHFMLFATQNPPGLYAGRKVLSRAFRNRFLEVHFDDVPEAELQTILCERCRIAPSRAEKIVSVFRELQKRRQSGRVFESKHGFATLRDLFRWGGRQANSDQELAEDGFMLLSERARREDDKAAVKEVIETIMKVKINEKTIYSLDKIDFPAYLDIPYPNSPSLVWTTAMQRLFILVTRALRFNEPVLLVGETGSGKTSVCQEFAAAVNKKLYALNCHQNTETADIIGGLRPVRNRGAVEAEILREVKRVYQDMGGDPADVDADSIESVLTTIAGSDTVNEIQRGQVQALLQKVARAKAIFEWHDGPLVEAMRQGDIFLLDEISLADDSVLERLNSVLEPSRTIVLAEKGGDETAVQADLSFKLVATMNPGGDYGKKELSPALRNRFTEIWVPAVDRREDLELIISKTWKYDALSSYTYPLLDFVQWLSETTGDSPFLNLRDILAWVNFSNDVFAHDTNVRLPTNEIFHHAAHMTYLDGLASVPALASLSRDSLQKLKAQAVERLHLLVPVDVGQLFAPSHNPRDFFQLGSFAIPRGPHTLLSQKFNFQAPTSQDNAMRVVRACQLVKPILLEGSPGVGKTSLITALAAMAGHSLCRINLSDQSDIIDLFGSDLPVEGGRAGEFAWKDGEFLKALQEGNWVLLDEMNLAPQAVLEGLNAVLDHRGTVYIPELGRSFVRHPSFRIFAAQNPLSQGGGRKGLPKSFMNRFTKVYIDQLSAADLVLVCHHYYPDMDRDLLQAMIMFNSSLSDAVTVRHTFGREGSPWEFNLRDVLRWCSLQSSKRSQPVDYLRQVYLHRFRNMADREQALSIFNRIFGSSQVSSRNPSWTIAQDEIQIGTFRATRENYISHSPPSRILQSDLTALEAAGSCISQSWLSILTGKRHSGKTSLARLLAQLTGHKLYEISINSATDTMDLLGGFEQVDPHSRMLSIARDTLSLVCRALRSSQSKSYTLMDEVIALRREMQEQRPSPSKLVEIASRLLNDVELFDSLKAQQLQALLLDRDAFAQKAGRFEWVDGPLVTAMKEGYWLLLDGANLCNPSVLDRLNSLCEEGGFLTLSERGFVDGKIPVLRPTRGFRLFMSVDPQHGELSRAMRNRGIEIAFLGNRSSHDHDILHDHVKLPAWKGLKTLSHFGGLRRATYSTPDVSITYSPSGRALEQFSSLSPLLDQIPSVLSTNSQDPNPSQHVLVRLIPSGTIQSFARWVALDSLNRFQEVPEGVEVVCRNIVSCVDVALARFRDEFRSLQGTSIAHSAAGPMDPYLFLPSSDSNNSLQHAFILKLMEVIVIITNNKRVVELGQNRQIKYNQKEHDRIHRTSLAVNALLSEIDATGHIVLQQSLQSTNTRREESLKDLSVACTLLRYASYLHKCANGSTLDYSSIQTIAKWIVDAAESFSVEYLSLVMCARTLQDITSLSSGLGLTEIWKSFLSQKVLDPPEISRLEALALNPSCSNDLRRQMANFMALATLRGFNPETNSITFIEDLEQRLASTSEQRHLPEPRMEILFAVIMLGLLAGSASGFSHTLKRSLEHFLQTVCYQPGAPLRRMIPFQQLLWLHDAGKDHVAVRSHLQFRWMKEMWGSKEVAEVTSLFSAVNLKRILCLYDWSHNRLSELAEYGRDLETCAQLCLINCESYLPRTQQIFALLRQSVFRIASCFTGASEEDSYSRTLVEAGDLHKLLAHIESADGFDKYPAFTAAMRTHFVPALKKVGTNYRPHCTHLLDLGMCWIAISRVVLELLIPDAPIDPVTVQMCSSNYWRQQELNYTMQLRLHNQLEMSVTGNGDSEVLGYLQRQLVEAAGQLRNQAPPDLHRNISRLHVFWAEVLQFQTQVLSLPRIDSLITLFETNTLLAAQQEEVLQNSVDGFVQRLEAAYSDFEDIISPLQYALLHFQMGMRIVRQSFGQAKNHEDLGIVLAGFPYIRSSDRLLLHPEVYHDSANGITAFQHVVLSTASIALQVSSGISISQHLSHLSATYEQALRLWNIDRAKEEEKEKVSQSLYRDKTFSHESVTDAELEEKEFMELFPSFESVLAPEPIEDQHVSTHRPVDTLVHESDARTFVRMHEWLCASSHKASISDIFSTFQTVRMELLSVVSKSDFLTESIDLESLPLQLWLLDRRFTSLQSPMTAQNKFYNFYADANIPEARKAVEIISQMKTRLQSLIQEWPDQMVLQHIYTRCNAFLALDIHSPIAKILTAIELLLLQTDDWEIYANRDNTLKSNRAAMVELIVTWRRLELSSWRALLEAQARDFEEGGVSGWWFRLYDVLIRGPLNASTGDPVDGEARLSKYIDELVPLLDAFIRDSPLGQFQARIRLLRSFESFCMHVMSVSDADRPTLERVRCVIHSTIGYFSLFTEALHTHLDSQRSALEAEVHDLVKLASWKDINVQALKQSAQRSHHQLYKIVRRFREVLRLPIADQLQPAMASGNEAHSTSFDSSALLKPSPVDPDHAHTSSTYHKFAQLVHQRIRPFLVSKTGRLVNGFAMEIILTSKDLAATTVSSNLPAEKRERQLKSLLSRKRKAFSDLLKELKRAGLSSSVKSEILNRNASPHWIREQPVIAEDSQVVERSESYLYRLNGLFPDLRQSLFNHHADLGTRELQRGILFLESAFALAVESRHRLAGISRKANQIDRIIRRLRMFQESQSIVSHGPSAFERLVEVNDVLTKAQTALQEMRNEMDTYSRRNPSAPTPQQIIEDCDTLMATSSGLQRNLSTIMESLSLTAHPVLLADEYNAVLEALGQINEIVLSLNRWIEIDPRLEYLFAPTAQWLAGFDLQTDFVSKSSVSSSDSIDGIISACLVCVQGLLTKCPEVTESAEEEKEDDDAYIKQECRDIREVSELLRADQMLALLNRLVLTLAARGSEYHANLRRVLPFLDLYARLVQAHVVAHSHFIAAFFKLNYVLCSVLLTLSKQGFCKPPEESQDDGGSGEGAAEMTDGVGMGEGTGNQNVSKEIEEESQVEGIKGDKSEEGRGPEKNQEDNDAIEMDQDFDGEMEDVPDEGDEQDGEKSDDEESRADPEEQIGDLDISDPAAVDEKLWGDEKGPQDSNKDDQKTNQDHSKSKDEESDVVAKEGGEKQSKQKEEKSGEASEEQEQPTEDEVMNEEQDSDEPGVSGAPMDEHVPEADTLDLPDDMDMNAGEQLPDEVDIGDEELDDIEDTEDKASPDDDNETLNRQEDVGKDAQDEDIELEGPEPPAAAEAESTDAEQGQEEEQENTSVAQPDISTGDGAYISEDDPNPDMGANNQGGEKGASSGVVGEDSSVMDAEDNKTESDPLRQANQPQSGEQTEPSQGAGHAQSGVEQGPQEAQSSSQLEHNPLRSLGDALKEVQQRFSDILNSEEREVPREQFGNSDASQIEYLRPEDDDHEMQALGPSGEEQASRLKDLRFLEDQKEEQPGISTDMDMDVGEMDANLEEPKSHGHSEVEKTSTTHQEDVEGAIVHDPHTTSSQHQSSQANNPDAQKADIEMEDDEDSAGLVAEAELRAWQADGLPDNRAEHIWRLYESLTHDLAYALCEQLRLILEPTLTTRLKGDYRTGKRLNMKKIIPYIASDYTKDKIWLRRTRPSQREYQVLIALDDSRSMAESHSVHLAYQTLALVSKALSRLEAGDIGIARFGEAVELLHGFEGAPFTDQAGVEVMKAFHFNQKATNVLSLVETSLRVLEAARERKAMGSSTAADLWQLEIIISDGMCQDHEKLRPVLRKAEEQKVMIVFIIVDSLHSTAGVQQPGGAAHGSILSMTKAEIVNVNGKMDMQIQRYLDSFPFEYYVVLRNVEALPEVLSATLKQFFERISEE